MNNDARLLSGLRICHGMSPAQTDAFVDACLPARVPAGTLLIGRGDDDRAMLFVREGEVEVFIGEGKEELVVGELGPGEHAGAMGLLRLTDRRTASARARTACTLLILEPEGLEALDRAANPFVFNLEADVIKGLIARQASVLHSLSRLAPGEDPEELWPPAVPSLLDRFENLLNRRTTAPAPAIHPINALRACPGMTEAPQAALQSLLQRLKAGRVDAGTVLSLEGGDRTDAFILVRGSIGRFRRARSGGEIALAALRPGALAGFESILELSAPPVSCVALEESLVLRVPRNLCVDALFERSPTARILRQAMLKSLGLRLDEVTSVLLEAVRASRTSGDAASEDTVDLDQEQMLLVACNASAGAF